jgi:hypothetical protein
VLLEARFPFDRLALALGLNLVYLAGAATLVTLVFRVALRRGLLPKLR